MTAFKTSLKVVWRSINSTLGDPLGLIRDVLFPILLICLASGFIAYHDIKRILFPSDVQMFQVVPSDEGGQRINIGTGEYFLAVIPFVSLFLTGLGIVLLAVLWHRREILHSRTLGGATTVISYVLYAVPIGLIAALSLILPSILLGYLTKTWTILCWAVALYFMFRVSPALPAAAIGRRVGYSAAWSATRKLASVCVFLVLFRLALSFVTMTIDSSLFQQGIPWVIIISGAMLLTVFEVLISIAIITQLYFVAFNLEK